MWYLSFSVWLTSLSMIISRSVYPAANGIIHLDTTEQLSLHFTSFYIHYSAMKYFWDQLWSLDCKEIKPVNPKGNQSWIFFGRLMLKHTPILWPPDSKNWFIWKDPDAGKNWKQEEKGTTEDDMVGWHHRLNGHEFEWILGDGEG